MTGAVFNAIADGLLSTFMPNTSTGKWIGYQILAGFGQGIGLQMVSENENKRRQNKLNEATMLTKTPV